MSKRTKKISRFFNQFFILQRNAVHLYSILFFHFSEVIGFKFAHCYYLTDYDFKITNTDGVEIALSLQAFGWLSKFDESKRFLLERPHLACEETANYLVRKMGKHIYRNKTIFWVTFEKVCFIITFNNGMAF